MKINKNEILQKHCYNELVYGRINKKLDTNFTNKESEKLIKKTLENTPLEFYKKKGKNYYISNIERNIRITVNSNTFRIISVDKLEK